MTDNDNDDGCEFSKLEAGFAEIAIKPRRISVEAQASWRHANKSDLAADDLDFNYDANADSLPPNHHPSMQDVLPALQYGAHLANQNNFAEQTRIECFDQTDQLAGFRTLDDEGLDQILDTLEQQDTDTDIDDDDGIPTAETSTGERLLVFFVPLTVKKASSFGYQVAMKSSSVQNLFKKLGANPEFLHNMLGRPDYWAPRTRWQYNIRDELTVCDYFCQHPRWNLQVQGSPLSVHVIRRLQTKLTAYVISHKVGDSSVHALQQLLNVGVDMFAKSKPPSIHRSNPFEIAVNKVDDHLAGLETSDRHRLTELTKSLQIISQQADSHLLNADVAIITAKGIRDTQAKLHDYLSTPKLFRQPAEDAIKYVIGSMEKQKMLFLNYKGRKDGTMSLVYNLVTQSDAANNIALGKSMKRDSTSMSTIATLTMLFLPGTFTSSVLSAGIFSSRADSMGISTSNLWWLWVSLTLPLTLAVLVVWWAYRRRSERTEQKKSPPQDDASASHLGFWSRKVGCFRQIVA
ncbi:hypothetical protein EsDP_00005200 [Epichloe bromicola]|uniref:Uncharacterized protein n=1 Tax=Epichloe bromicola TaxID=79588 RepID=A0ABQ0CU34_9HYPO